MIDCADAILKLGIAVDLGGWDVDTALEAQAFLIRCGFYDPHHPLLGGTQPRDSTE